MTDRSHLTENELKALAYFVVGVSSEGSIGGRDVSRRLSFAGRYSEGKMYPVENSGFSIGTLQKDLGQDGMATAEALVEAYQAWATVMHPDKVFTDADVHSIARDLARKGNEVRDDGNRAIDPRVKGRIDAFLASPQGLDFVHSRDSAQVDHIYTRALTKLAETPAYTDAPGSVQLQLAAIIGKGFNQNERITRRLLEEMKVTASSKATVRSLEDVIAYSEHKFTTSMREGRDSVLRNVEVFDRLRHSSLGNPIHRAWQEVLAEPLIKPTQTDQIPERPDLAAHYTIIKNLFLDPARAKHFIEALERGGEYAHDSRHPVGVRGATASFFTSQGNFVQWNAEGLGIAYRDGVWSEVSHDEVTRTRLADSSVDLAIQRNGVSEPFLHVGLAESHALVRTLRQGMHGDDVRALQTQLAQLGFTDARGRPMRPDGDFGPTTHTAIQAFQCDHALTADGIAGRATLMAVHSAVEAEVRSLAQPDRSYLELGEPEKAASVYQAFAPKPAVSVMPTVEAQATQSKIETPREAAAPGPDADATRALQQNLNTLGVRDMRGKPLAADGQYGILTQTAVARFQSEQGLPATGQADERTQSVAQAEAFIADLKHRSPRTTERHAQQIEVARHPVPLHEAPMHASASRSAGPRSLEHTINDPRHPGNPDHALYNELHRRLPAAAEKRLLQLTAACHENGINADNLRTVHVNSEKLAVGMYGDGPLATPAVVDLKQPSPSPEQSIGHIQQFDQQQAQMMQEIRTQNAQLSQQGPHR